MKAQYRLPKEITGSNEKNYTADLKNIFQLFRFYIKAKKEKATAFFIFFSLTLLISISATAQKLDTLSTGRINLIVKGDTLETFKPGYKRYVVVNGKRKNVFKYEPKEPVGSYEFAKF